jgi:hypothetical protein
VRRRRERVGHENDWSATVDFIVNADAMAVDGRHQLNPRGAPPVTGIV